LTDAELLRFGKDNRYMCSRMSAPSNIDAHLDKSNAAIPSRPDCGSM
jgi:hypothetical protein